MSNNLDKINHERTAKLPKSWEHKSAWVQLIALLISLALYAGHAGVMVYNGVQVLGAYVPVFVLCTIALVVIMILGHALALIGDKPAPRDERDMLIEWRSEARSGWLLGAGVFCVMVAMIMGCSPLWSVHGLLFSLYISECTKLILQIRAYATA